MANATMQALQTHAEKLNQQVAEVNASIKALGDVPDDNSALQEYRKQLRRLNSDLKDVNTTMKDYTRGVKAAGELYRHYAMGNIEDMSIKAIRAGVNGMKKRYDNLKAGGDPGDAEEMRLIEAITTEADVVVKRFKTDYQHVVEEIARGGTVTEQTLKRTRDGLADLMQTAETEAEKNELTNYWQKVGAAIEAVAVENRRLRGEVADREEAMRIAYATDHDGSQQAIHDAEARADAARRENDELRQRLDLKQQQRRELEQKMENNSIQQQTLTDRRDELKAQEKEDRAIRNQRVDDANKELNAARRAAKTQQQAYDEQKQTVEKLRTEVQGLTDDIRKMGEVKAEPKIDTSGIDELKAKLESLKAKRDELDGVIKTQGELSDRYHAEFEELSKLPTPRDKMKKFEQAYAKFRDKMKSSLEKLPQDHFIPYNGYADTIGAADVQMMSRHSVSETDFKASVQRNLENARAYLYERAASFTDQGKSTSLDDLKFNLEQMKKLQDEYKKALKDTDWKKSLYNEDGQSKQGVQAAIDYYKALIKEYESAIKQIETLEAKYKSALETPDNSDRMTELTEKSTEATNALLAAVKEKGKVLTDITETEGKLATAQQQSATAQQQSAQSSEQLAQKQEQLSQKTAELNQQQDKLNGMVDETVTANQRLARAEQEQTDARNAQAEAKKHEGEAVKKVEDELRGLTDEQLKNGQAYSHLTEEINADTAAMQRNITTEQEATREADRLRSGSIDKMEQALARLRESNRKLDPTIDKEEWERGERAIGQLTLRLEELKKQSAELRGEWMTVADAMKYADSIGTEGFVTTDAETKKATEALQRQRETLVSLIHEKERDGDATADERQELARFETALAKISTGFADADEVMKRFSEHMKGTVVTTPGQSIDEQLSQHTSVFDDDIKRTAENVDYYEQQIKEATDELERMEKELAELEKKHANSSWFRKQTSEYKREGYRIEGLRDAIEGETLILDDGTTTRTGQKGQVEWLSRQKQTTQDVLDYYKQQKAEALGLVEVEEQLQKARRMTRDEMQEGIKVLEAEAMAQDRSTADGQKRWEELRKTIGEMNQELKEATGEWMKLADAQKIAEGAGKKGFSASAQEIQQATQALERRREELIKQIRAERDLGNAVDAQEKELDDLTKKLRSLKFEQDNVNMSQEKMRTLIETPANAVNLDELRAAIKRADGQLRQMQQSLGQNSSEYKRFAEQVRNAKNVMKEMEGQAKASATAWEKAFNRLKTYVVMYMGFNELWQKVSNTARDLMDLSDRMGEVRKTTGFTADEVGRLSENLKKMDVRTSLTSLMEISASAGQLGLKTLEDVQGFTEAANKLMIALPEMGREAATEMMRVAIATGEVDKIRKQLQEGTIEGSSATAVAMEKIASTIDRLRATSASTAPEITDLVKRVGAVGAQSGITIDQVAALGSTISSLGMRVEMSATALSRMIPAIRNNAYEIGAIIGKTEEDIKRRFAEGQGMTVIIDLFKAIRERSGITAEGIENDADGVADKVEKMMEAAGFQDIMKELNQQGARAGIVFAGLSQNVEELERQLGVASEAYEENIAIQQEFDKMNETTAAKWERLKNEFEEMWIGDEAQRALGVIIDLLRGLVNLLSGNVSPALKAVSVLLKTFIVYWGLLKIGLGEGIFFKSISGLKAMGTGLKGLIANTQEYIMLSKSLRNAKLAEAAAMTEAERATAAQSVATIRAKMATKALNKEMMANIWMALATAILYAVYALSTWVGEVDISTKAVEELNAKIDEEKDKLDKLVKSYYAAYGNMEKRKNLMNEINQKYSQYLGFLLTDAENSNLVALAHERIAAALEAEMLQREKTQVESRVKEHYSENLAEEWIGFVDDLRDAGLSAEQIARARNDIKETLRQISYNPNSDSFQIPTDAIDPNKIEQYLQSKGVDNPKEASENAEVLIATWVYKYLEETFPQITETGLLPNITGVGSRMSGEWGWVGNTIKNFRTEYTKTYLEMTKEIGKASEDINAQISSAEKRRVEDTQEMINNFKEQGERAVKVITAVNSSEEDIAKAYENLAGAINGLQTLAEELRNAPTPKEIQVPLLPQPTVKDAQSAYLPWMIMPSIDQNRLSQTRETQRQRVNQDVGNNNYNNNNNDNDDPLNHRGPYGNYDKRVDPYEQWDANALVKRRKEMLERVRALAGGADVQKVLSMDKKFMDEATRKGIKNMRDAIAWYNEERLKIQEELDARNLTPTGDWKNPEKGGRSKKKPKTPESEGAIAELDRYYSERKELIEEARANEQMTEAEYNRRLDALEQEHLTKRSELRQTFTSEDKQFIQQFRQWWASVKELDEVSWTAIEAEWIAAWERDRKYNNREAQKDLTAMQAIVVKQLKEIEAIIAKERPFNGITDNLQNNLTKMGLLFKDGVPEDGKFMEENTKRLTFLLKEAENAYSLTFDQLAEDMRKNGLGSWADAIINSENADKEKRAIIAQLHEVYDQVQDAIKKEASQVKKQVDIAWNDAILPNGKSMKATYEAAISALGVQQSSVSRANNLIGAGVASERVADKLAIKQLQLQLRMQEHYYNLVRKTGQQRVDDLLREAKLREDEGKTNEAERLRLDAKHAQMSLNLSLAKEETELAKQREEIIARTEESQNRLYTELKEWADLLTSSLQGVFEASHAGDAEYYNERAKLDLTGKGGPGAGTYVVIDDAGTSDAKAHYEYLDESQALERQHEIEVQNAQAEAWKKLWDDINMKMSETITDQLNALLQNSVIDANTQAVIKNTEALYASMGAAGGSGSGDGYKRNAEGFAVDEQGQIIAPVQPTGETPSGEGVPKAPWQMTDEEVAKSQENMGLLWQTYKEQAIAAETEKTEMLTELPGYVPSPLSITDEQIEATGEKLDALKQKEIAASTETAQAKMQAQEMVKKSEQQNDQQMVKTNKSSFAAMTAAANMYGIAYQTMSNDNLDTSQKVQMMIVQAAGQAAISMLTASMAASTGETAANAPSWISKTLKELGPIGGPVAVGVFTALIGGLMGLATSKIAKSKSEIAQATGASVGAGRLSTGMLTYAEGNVNELTDPASLTPGRQYNVDGADGKTYRAKYMGKDAKTHITNGPEFHLVGEAGREAIIDAKTTRLLQMNETGIWRDIQTLYNGGSIAGLSTRRRRGTGVRAFADGNIGEFEEMADGGGLTAEGTGGMSIEMLASLQASIDRQSDLLESALVNGIKAVNKWTGSDGIPAMYNKMQKEAQRHGEKYL